MAKEPYTPDQGAPAQGPQETAFMAAFVDAFTRLSKQVSTTPAFTQEAKNAIAVHAEISSQLAPGRLAKGGVFPPPGVATQKQGPRAS